MAEKEIAVKVEHLTKSFKIPLEASNGIKQKLINTLKGRKGYREFTPLKDISFEIEKGDFFGIVGRNGSGKSTLLKSIAGIYTPNGGHVQVNGKLVPFIELGVGFNPELTGRENVYLNGALLGFSHKEMDAMYDDIVDFAELEEFMEERLKNYSSGMQVRLAFSIAIRAEADVLLLDEVLAVGDEAFQRKCNEYFATLRDDGKTVILVTHSMDSVRRYCNKAIMIDSGKVKVYGSPEDVANEYSAANLENIKRSSDTQWINNDIQDINVRLLSPKSVTQKDEVVIEVGYKVVKELPTKIILNLIDSDRQTPLVAASIDINATDGYVKKQFKINLGNLNDSNIKTAVSIRDSEDKILAFPSEETLPTFIFRRTDYPLDVKGHRKKSNYAVFFDRGKWS